MQDSYVPELFVLKPSHSLQLFSKITTYSGETLRKLNKDNLIGIALSLPRKMKSSNAKVFEELKLLNDKLEILEAGLLLLQEM